MMEVSIVTEDDDGLALELGQRDSNDDSSEDSDEVIAANASADTGRAGPNDGSRISFVKDEGGVDSNTEKKKEAPGNLTQPKYIPTGWAEPKSKANPGPTNITTSKRPTTESPAKGPVRLRNVTTSRNVFALDDGDDDDEPPSRPPPELLAKRITANEDIIMGAPAIIANSLLLFGALCLRQFML
ncbi:uncharacterized protein LOC113228759 [Hyposmocoma kahamanoa]|uniref:uncharacterized protein LOC113228759 n=1 Tax=Hyposmocoma kahamanoa TaxID=1477025 RepID=UPI000E6D5CAF|nr:uncharacterized protein LOC113228759 [Hyposmocoma kahamanoa]